MFRGGLWRHRDFSLLWGGQTVSAIGDRVSTLAVPTAAILLLKASPFEVGLLYVCWYLPYPLLALPAGVFVDRLPRRRLLIASDAGRFAATASIPVAAALGHLTLLQLYLVALLLGCFSTVFEVAYRSYLPVLVSTEEVVTANSRLEASEGTAATVGPGIGGLLVQLLTAPYALVADAASYLVSVLTLMAIAAREPAPDRSGEPPHFLSELREGVAALLRHPLIRWTAACVATSNCGLVMANTVFLLFAYQALHLQPAAVGAVLLVFGLAGVAGAAVAPEMARRLGTGSTLAASIFLESLGWALIPLALVLPLVPVLGAGMLLRGFFGPVWNVTNVSLRQNVVPARLQGRMHASHLAIAFGTIPVGALAGGWLAGILESALGRDHGLALTLALGAVLGMSSVAWILLSPVRTLRGAAAPEAALTPI